MHRRLKWLKHLGRMSEEDYLDGVWRDEGVKRSCLLAPRDQMLGDDNNSCTGLSQGPAVTWNICCWLLKDQEVVCVCVCVYTSSTCTSFKIVHVQLRLD